MSLARIVLLVIAAFMIWLFNPTLFSPVKPEPEFGWAYVASVNRIHCLDAGGIPSGKMNEVCLRQISRSNDGPPTQ